MESPGPASHREITFYRVNDIGQYYEIELVRHTDEPGCHGFFKTADVIRVGQVGFAYCEVFTDDDCADSSAVVATWSGKAKRDESKKQPTTRMTEGNQWFLHATDNVELQSWRCVAKS